MKFKNIFNLLKTAGAIFLLNALENFLLLILFGISPSIRMVIGIFVFTLSLTLVLKLIHVLKEE